MFGSSQTLISCLSAITPDIDIFKSESILRNFILGFPPSVTSDFVKIFLLFIAEFGFDRKSLTSLHHNSPDAPCSRLLYSKHRLADLQREHVRIMYV